MAWGSHKSTINIQMAAPEDGMVPLASGMQNTSPTEPVCGPALLWSAPPGQHLAIVRTRPTH